MVVLVDIVVDHNHDSSTSSIVRSISIIRLVIVIVSSSVVVVLMIIIVLGEYGGTWTLTTAPTGQWYSIASDSTGQYLAAVTFPGNIYTSSSG